MFDGNLLNAFLTLAVSVAAIGGLFYLLKKVSRKSKSKNNDIDFEILSKIPLQGKSSLFAVRVGNKKILLGVSDQNISMIGELPSNDKKNKSIQQPKIKSDDPIIKNNIDALKKAYNQMPEQESIDQDDDVSLSFGSFLKSTFKKN